MCTQGLQYEEWLGVVQKAIEILPQEAQNDILRDTASRFYGFRNEAALKQISWGLEIIDFWRRIMSQPESVNCPELHS